jgi:hypothetical protein
VDTTAARRAEPPPAARVLAESFFDAVREPRLVLDHPLPVVRGNRWFHRWCAVDPRAPAGQDLADLGDGQWTAPRLHELLSRTLKEGIPFDDFDVEHELPSLGRRRLRLNGRPVQLDDGDAAALVLLGFEDVTEGPPP